MTPKFFPLFSPKTLLFLEKLLNEKIFKTSFPIKKVIFIFVAGCPLPFKRDVGSRNCSFEIFSKNAAYFLKKLLNNISTNLCGLMPMSRFHWRVNHCIQVGSYLQRVASAFQVFCEHCSEYAAIYLIYSLLLASICVHSQNNSEQHELFSTRCKS